MRPVVITANRLLQESKNVLSNFSFKNGSGVRIQIFIGYFSEGRYLRFILVLCDSMRTLEVWERIVNLTTYLTMF